MNALARRIAQLIAAQGPISVAQYMTLALHDAEAAQLVQLKFFGGFTFAEAGELLNISERTAKRVWSYARAWLHDEMTQLAVSR